MADTSADEFYARIRMLVKQNNITLLTLCVNADFNINTYNTACHNKRFLKADVVARMAKILGVSTDFLLTGREHGQETNTQQETLLHIIYALEGEHLDDVTKMARFCLSNQQAAKADKKAPTVHEK